MKQVAHRCMSNRESPTSTRVLSTAFWDMLETACWRGGGAGHILVSLGSFSPQSAGHPHKTHPTKREAVTRSAVSRPWKNHWRGHSSFPSEPRSVVRLGATPAHFEWIWGHRLLELVPPLLWFQTPEGKPVPLKKRNPSSSTLHFLFSSWILLFKTRANLGKCLDL